MDEKMDSSFMKNYSKSDVCIVTVTYGSRLELLEQQIKEAMKCDLVGMVLVVDNGSKNSLTILSETWGKKITIIHNIDNLGSAHGYYIGVQAALHLDFNYIMLLDDDLAPARGSIEILYSELKLKEIDDKNKLNAVVGFRKDHQFDIARGVKTSNALPMRSSFINFHFMQIPHKILKRLNFLNRTIETQINQQVKIPFAPYGGFFASKKLYQKIGLPNRDLVLYADDHEYTYRISRFGGDISLIINAPLVELESSWNVQKNYSNSFEGLLLGESDFRAFYTIRNHAWFSRFIWSKSLFEFNLNKYIFMAIIFCVAIKNNRMVRYGLIRKAIKDGVNGELGINKNYKLQ